MTHSDVLVVGSGHGGVQAASALRQSGFTGSVAILSAEIELPYERPPLSKEYLTGDKDVDSILARPATFWAEKKIDLILGERALSIDPSQRQLTCDSGKQYSYRKLIWAAGGEPRRLTCDGHDLDGVHTIRSRGDVDRLRCELSEARHVVIIGGGYIGLEAAASLTKLGKHVTVLEAMDRLLARVAGKPLSNFFLAAHRDRGVDIHLGAEVRCIEGRRGRAVGVLLANNKVLPADLVIVGIGIVPAVAPLAAAGAECPNGVAVNEFCRTSLTGVHAIGDCALHHNVFGPDRPVRIESVQNAVDMASVVARDIIGNPTAYRATPWFWSNQFDIKLQTVGLNSDYDDALVRGEPLSGRFSVIYLREDKIVALDCVNMVKDFVQGRGLVERGVAADAARLVDPEIPLKSFIKQD